VKTIETIVVRAVSELHGTPCITNTLGSNLTVRHRGSFYGQIGVHCLEVCVIQRFQ
jgi:hypothetical protein